METNSIQLKPVSNRRLKAYSKYPKYKLTRSTSRSRNTLKERVKDINRSGKKSVRFEVKRDIKARSDEYYTNK